ncbi:uncharacterized protein ISCGN_024553 [Ixodes scapularis]
MSSVGAAITAQPGRGDRNDSASQEYEIIVPPLPTGPTVLNTAFLHADVRGRPYRVEDFRDTLGHLGLLPEVLALGAYHMKHVWAVTFKSLDGKRKILAAGDLVVKGHRCVSIDPGNRDIRIKLHWLHYHVPDDEVRAAFAPYGHIRIAGGMVLVVVPGRAPLCLCCERTGHIRRECRVPECGSCYRFGHDAEHCVRTYAAAAGPGGGEANSEHDMDEADAEEAVEGVGPSAEMPVEKATKKPDQVASDGQPKPVVAKSAVVFAAIPDPATGNKGGATTKAASPGDKSTTATAVLPVNENARLHDRSIIMLLGVLIGVAPAIVAVSENPAATLSVLERAENHISELSKIVLDLKKSLRPRDCGDLLKAGQINNGVYVIFPTSDSKGTSVYCDMNTDGGGWTVIQNRGQYGNSAYYFYRNWTEYANGFGERDKEYWIGPGEPD